MKPMKTLPNLIDANLFLTPALKKYWVIVNIRIVANANVLGLTFNLIKKALVARC